MPGKKRIARKSANLTRLDVGPGEDRHFLDPCLLYFFQIMRTAGRSTGWILALIRREW